MALPNANISNLPLYSSIKPGFWLAMDDMNRVETVRLDIKELLASPISQNFEWVTDNDPGYQLNDVVTYGGKWWQSLVNDNLNNTPGVDDAIWHELPKSASGFVPWAPGVYPQDLPFVYVNLGTLDNPIVKMYVLASPVRPYVSTDIVVEVAAGDWIEWPVATPPTPTDGGPFVQEKDADGVTASYTVTGYTVTRMVTVFKNGIQQRLGTDYTITGLTTIQMTAIPTLADRIAIMFMGVAIPGGDFVVYDTGETVFEDDGVTEVEYV